jgi:hypothetical protein
MKRAYVSLQMHVLDFEFKCVQPAAQHGSTLALTIECISPTKHLHGHISTWVWFGNSKKTPAGAFSQDEVRITNYFKGDLFGWGRCCCHGREGVRFTEQPCKEVWLFTMLDRVRICLAETESVIDCGARTDK